MKGRSSALFFAAAGLLFLLDSAHSQILGPLAAPLVSLEAGAKPMPEPTSGIIHIVRRGDNLIGISKIYNTTPEALISANGLASSKILIGQKLRIPVLQNAAAEETPDTNDASAFSYDSYTVRRGDNLIGISKIYSTTPEALISANGLTSSKILIGQNLRVPVPRSAAAEKTPDTNDASAFSYDSYTVRRGDNLIGISKIYGTTPEALISANGLTSSKILIGQNLLVPVPRSAAAEETPDTKVASASPYAPSVISNVLLQQDKNSGGKVQPRRVQLVEAGFKLLGAKYRFSGLSEKSGFDCSGLVKNLFSKFNINLPHSSREQFKQGEKVDRDKLEEGDLVFFSSGGKLPNHVGIYIGNDHFIHAAQKAKKVIVSDLNQLWYAARYLGARRITDLWGDDRDPAVASN